jgi:hypothetical protein
MSPLIFDYQARPEGDGWVIVEIDWDRASKDVRIIRRTKTKEEAEASVLEDMDNAAPGWALRGREGLGYEYHDIRPEGDEWILVEIIWEPIERHVKIMGRTKTKEEAEALACQFQEAQRAGVAKMLKDWQRRNHEAAARWQGPPTAWQAATKGQNMLDVVERMAGLAVEFKRAHPDATMDEALAEARRAIEAEAVK